MPHSRRRFQSAGLHRLLTLAARVAILFGSASYAARGLSMIMHQTFSESVKWHFKYLIDEYGFAVKERLYGSGPFSDGLIEFWSDTTVVVIQLDRFDLMISLGPATEPESVRLGLERVIGFLMHDTPTLRLSLPTAPVSRQEIIEVGLTQYAPALRRYCDSILRGDLSWWPAACQYTMKALQTEYRALTGLELPPEAYQSLAQYAHGSAKLRE